MYRLIRPVCVGLLLSLLSALVLVGCSGGNDGPGPGDTPVDADMVDAERMQDTSATDLPDMTAGDSVGGDGAPDVVTVETDGEVGISQGVFGEPCDDNGDCLSGYCVPYLGDKVCTRVCVEDCAQGWKCVELQGGREPVWVCLSDFAHLCLPCTKSADCVFGSVTEVACVSYGPGGAFCGAVCETHGDCPAGFSCSATTTTEGLASSQCVLLNGLCPCGGLAAQLGLGSLCFHENEWGICIGTRICADGGLTSCDASIPAKEVCNQLDDDCDGFVDEEIVNCCVCGDGTCHTFCESVETCGPDCAVCGDGICSPGEGPCECPIDCCGICGDGKCASYSIGGQECCTEDPESCPTDCATSTCGDLDCEPGEHPLSCPQDCELFFCGNGVCEPGEEAGGEDDCTQDCTEFCGNCACDPGEFFLTCPIDCGFCGDGLCSPCGSLGEDLETCFQDCCDPDCEGKDCGPDGCGGTCGQCPEGDQCSDDALCETDCGWWCLGQQCGTPLDWCDCGTCAACGQICSDGQCVFIGCEGKECGPDGCGGTCGSCPPFPNFICSAGACSCIPDTCESLGMGCSEWPDGCGGTLQCGSCPEQHVCTGDGQCLCIPECANKDCGDDGCGGSCGACESGDICFGFGVCLGVKFVPIPGGTFQMGCSPGDDFCLPDEFPLHSVTLSPFEMLETEVTEGQFQAVLLFDPSCDYNGGGGENSPVECMDFFWANTFCSFIGARLPTEAEWEYAARGGTDTAYYCGYNPECLDGIAWTAYNSDDGAGWHKHDVKQKAPNAFGLYDMLGNVWERTSDWYSDTYYEISPSTNPSGPESGTEKATHGGCFLNGADEVRVSKRGHDLVSYFNPLLGLRCVR